MRMKMAEEYNLLFVLPIMTVLTYEDVNWWLYDYNYDC